MCAQHSPCVPHHSDSLVAFVSVYTEDGENTSAVVHHFLSHPAVICPHSKNLTWSWVYSFKRKHLVPSLCRNSF